ncbi:unnamed protein product [Mytilus coruscus]|uniref:DUF3504 domain-containing protein n=1 Tax=Mytilus coruscus TaxID=42192 RepID=A0A6J8DI60_MYTCO|nr:unnamed protein product [Mytilus coruscus]
MIEDDAIVEDYFHYDDLSNIAAEYIRRNLADVNGDGNLVLEDVDPANFDFPNKILHDIENTQNDEDDKSDKENSSSSKRFCSVTDENIDSFLPSSVNKYTNIKTKKRRDPVEIPALDSLLSRFFLGVLKKNGEDYEPDSLSSMYNSLDRHLKDSKSSIRIKKDSEFNHTRQVLEAKLKAFKSLGKGSKPNRAKPLTTQEIQILREKGVIGTQNPDALPNAVFLNNATYLGLRGRQDHINMTWGDVELKATSDGKEYLEFNGGWKGIGTVTHYSVPSIEQQQQAHTISKVIMPYSDLQTTSDSEELCELSNSNILVHNNLNANVSDTNNQTANKHDNPMSMFSGATITGSGFNINIYSGEIKK